MTSFSCDKCHQQFSKKSGFESHKRRKIPCKGNDITTFVDLYKFLQSYKDNLLEWLQIPWIGYDKQESLLRLFAGLQLISKLDKFHICHGNFNLQTLEKIKHFKEIFYNNDIISLKDKGDSSDLSAIHKDNDKIIMAASSKNNNNYNVGKMDIDKILTNFRPYEKNGFQLVLCLVVRDRLNFKELINNIEKTNFMLKELLQRDDTIIIDWSDLNDAFHQFKLSFGKIPIEQILNSNKSPLVLKLHQMIGVRKTLRLKNEKEDKILWGQIQRSGKSYIMAGTIIEDYKDKIDSNYLIITTAPNETIEQYLKVFDCVQLSDFNVIHLNDKHKKPKMNKNIIICSKQFLQSKIDKSIKWLKTMKFEIRFLDESHNGGTTDLTQKTLNHYGNDALTIQITATYSKPIHDYNIPKSSWILWDLEDIRLCKTIDRSESVSRLVEKHGDDFNEVFKLFSKNQIINEYSKYPELSIITDEIKPEYVQEIIEQTLDNNYGWSSDGVF